MTPRQETVLQAIQTLTDAMGYPPTVRELGKALAISGPGAIKHLDALARGGIIHREPATARAIQVIKCQPCGESTH
jgi:repressor LexA